MSTEEVDGISLFPVEVAERSLSAKYFIVFFDDAVAPLQYSYELLTPTLNSDPLFVASLCLGVSLNRKLGSAV